MRVCVCACVRVCLRARDTEQVRTQKKARASARARNHHKKKTPQSKQKTQGAEHLHIFAISDFYSFLRNVRRHTHASCYTFPHVQKIQLSIDVDMSTTTPLQNILISHIHVCVVFRISVARANLSTIGNVRTPHISICGYVVRISVARIPGNVSLRYNRQYLHQPCIYKVAWNHRKPYLGRAAARRTAPTSFSAKEPYN